MRKLLLFFAMLCVSIGTWADNYYITRDDQTWFSNVSDKTEQVVKINLVTPGTLGNAIDEIDQSNYQIMYIDTPSGSLNAADIAALSKVTVATLDLQDAFKADKSAFTFSNKNIKYLILPDGWTKEEVNTCAQAIAEENSNFCSAVSQDADGMSQISTVTHYYYTDNDNNQVEYSGTTYTENGQLKGTITETYNVDLEYKGSESLYTNTWAGDKKYDVGNLTVTDGKVTPASFDVKLTVAWYSDEARNSQVYPTASQISKDEGGYYWYGYDNVKAYLYPKFTYQDQANNWQWTEYTGETTLEGETYYGNITNPGSVSFDAKTYYIYTYTENNEEKTERFESEQTQKELTRNVVVDLTAEDREETSVLGASLVAYVNKPNTLYDTVMHTWFDQKSNNKIGDGINNHNQQFNKIKSLTISGNAVAHDWSGGPSQINFVDGHMVFDKAADELGGAAYAAVGGGTRSLTGTACDPTFKGAGVLYLDLRDVKIDDQYCEDLTLSMANILISEGSCVEVWLPAEGSGLKTIPADFGTNVIREICIPSNIETIRTRAFPSVKHIWTTAGTETDKESWEDGYTKYDNGAVTETLADGTVSPTHTSSATSVVEHIGFKANQGDVTYGTYTFGSNLKLIESNAFTNSEPNVKDVYVLNTTAPECHVDAFNTAMYYGNNGYNASLISSEGIVTRDAYENHGRWITMLHYPKQTKAPDLQRYTDPTRKYSVATGDKDGNGATIYYPNHSEFGYAYAQGTTGYVWNAWDNSRTGSANAMNVNGHVTTGWNTTVQATSNANYASTKARENENWEYSAFYDVSVNGTDPNPAPTTYSSVYWSESAYELAGSQKDNTYVQLYDKDYRGWHQFVLNGYSANTTREVVFERSYIKDSDWWTICLPYDLTYSEMIKFFGTETQLPILSRLLYVTRDIEKEKITLNFSKNLMLYKDNMTLTADGIEDISSTSGSVAANDVVLHAGVPYVIKPYIPTSGSSELATRRFAIYKDTEEGLYNKLQAATELGGDELIRLVENGLYTVPALVVNNTGANAEAVEEGKTVPIGSTTYQVSSVYKYTMVGSLFNNQLPSYCYYLGWKWDNAAKTQGHACFWYNKKTGEANQKWAWTNNTCIICPNWPENLAVHKATSTADPARWIVGGDANTVDDDSYVASGSSQKARSNDILPEAETPVSSSATGISEIKNEEVVSGQNKVYDIDGRFVGNGTSGLTKGVYIVNGKKIIK